MKQRFLSSITASAFMLVPPLTLTGCDRTQEIAPPVVHLGEDICDGCGMIVSDERFAASIIAENAQGERLSLLFDDIGDMIDYEITHADLRILASYAHDYATLEWINARDAWYARSETLRAPMASGVAACSDRAACDLLLESHPGDALRYADLQRLAEAGELRFGAEPDRTSSDDTSPAP